MRFGVMVDSTTLDAWQARCLKDLLAIPGVQLALVIVNHGHLGERDPGSLRSKLSKLAAPIRHGWFLWTVYYLTWVKRRVPALEPVDMSAILASVPTLNCQVELRGRFSEYFQPVDVESIKAQRLDFILRFGFGMIRGDILGSATHGVWSYHHGEPGAYRGQPAGFWELFNGDACSGCVLQRLTDTLDGGEVLRRGVFQTRPNYLENLDELLGGSSAFAAHVCRELLDTGSVPRPASSPISRSVVTLPSNGLLLRFLVRNVGRQIRHHWGRWWVQEWNVGLVHRDVRTLLEGRHVLGNEVSWLESKSTRFLADPFIVRCDSHTLDLLVEEYTFGDGKGTIAALQITRDGRLLDLRTAIDSPWHLSYPHVMHVGHELWCVPESATSRGVTGYRYDSETKEWTAERLLDNIGVIDPTMLWHEDRWWMFYTDWRIGDVENLCIAWSHDLRGPWRPHPRNPVKLDVGSSRPAGAFFVVDGVLYRPAQDCSRGYGGGIVIHRVRHLGMDRFDEEAVAWIGPEPMSAYPSGLHTITLCGDSLVVDGLRYRFAPWSKLRDWIGERRLSRLNNSR